MTLFPWNLNIPYGLTVSVFGSQLLNLGISSQWRWMGNNRNQDRDNDSISFSGIIREYARKVDWPQFVMKGKEEEKKAEADSSPKEVGKECGLTGDAKEKQELSWGNSEYWLSAPGHPSAPPRATHIPSASAGMKRKKTKEEAYCWVATKCEQESAA